jgi:hypothetical protein
MLITARLYILDIIIVKRAYEMNGKDLEINEERELGMIVQQI